MDLGKNASFLAQVAHFFSGLGLTLLGAQFMPLWLAASATGLGYGFKESLEALGWAFWEPKQPWYSSLIDFTVAFAGIVVAIWR